MDIHPPEKPIHSWRDFLIQLATITAGILIALSLEGLREWQHHRALVQEARENITRELEGNRRTLKSLVDAAPKLQADQKMALRLVDELGTKRSSDIHSITLAYSFGVLNTAAWQTAQATGALGYMKYEDVQEYSGVYEVQQQFSRVQEKVVANWVPPLMQVDPTKASVAELQDARQHILQTLTSLQTEVSLAAGLVRDYGTVLAKK